MDDLVLEQLKAIRRDMATKDDLRDVATKDDLAPLTTKVELEGLRSEMLRHFVEVETRVTTEVHELISLLRELVTSATVSPRACLSSNRTCRL